MSIKGFEVGGVQAKYDYESLDNIPANLVQDANYVHTDNNYTNADKTKLSGIEAQANKTTIDATLTQSGQAADAKATGDAISALDAQVIASMPHDTASGAIASFPDGAAMPVIDCSVAVAPNQNLHGYDNPWPSGGGKNLFDKDAPGKQVGYALDYNNGSTYQTGSGNYSTSDFIPVVAGQNYIASGNSKATDYCWYDSGKVFISGGGNIDAAKTAPSNAAYARIDYWKADENSIQFEQNSSATSYAPYSNICPISGWTECKVTRTGKNLLSTDGNNLPRAYNGVSFSMADGHYIIEASEEKTGYPFARIGQVKLKPGTYTLSINRVSGVGVRLVDRTVSPAEVKWGTNTSFTFTVAETTNILDVDFSSTASEMSVGTYILYPMLEVGSTASSYEPCQGQTYTIDLDGTRYGGTLDVTTGKLTVDRAMQDLGALSYTYTSSSAQFRSTTALNNALLPVDSNDDVHAISSMYKVAKYADLAANDFYLTIVFQGSFAAGQVWLKNSNYTNETVFKTAMSGVQLVYELATPIEVDLTPTEITTLLGTNNIFADCGDTTVDYYADTTLFVNKKIAAAVAALS